jgi:hypothetical protein
MVGKTGQTVRRPGLPPLLFAPVLLAAVLFAAVLPACIDLQKVDPGPRLVDDFESGDLIPRWNRFGTWTCGVLASHQADASQDASQDDQDGGAAAGQAPCEVDTPGDLDMHALRYRFVLNEPPAGNQSLAAAVVTRTISGPVDVSGFKQFVFSAYLESDLAASPSSALPSGTQFQVQLGCSTIRNDRAASQTIGVPFQASSWLPTPFTIRLDQFPAQSRACLAEVDSISFTILLPALPSGTSKDGTLHIDNISLLN